MLLWYENCCMDDKKWFKGLNVYVLSVLRVNGEHNWSSEICDISIFNTKHFYLPLLFKSKETTLKAFNNSYLLESLEIG